MKIKTEPLDDEEIKIEYVNPNESEFYEPPVKTAVLCSTESEFFEGKDVFIKSEIKIEDTKIANSDEIISATPAKPTPTEEKGVRCKICFKIYANVSSRNHHLKTHETPFECNECPEKFSCKYFLNRHKYKHLGLTCKVCSKQFSRRYSLQVHMRVHNADKLSERSESLTKFIVNEISRQYVPIHTEREPFECDLCKNQFRTLSNLRQHMAVHSMEKPFRCDQCSRIFHTEYFLQTHMLFHKRKNPPMSTSDQRPKKLSALLESGHFEVKPFETRNYLREHIQRIHIKEKPFECVECKNRFPAKRNLIRHIKLVHKKERPFQCEECPKTFGLIANLNKHKHIHSGEKPFSCNECHRKFALKEVLKQHMKIHTELIECYYYCE